MVEEEDLAVVRYRAKMSSLKYRVLTSTLFSIFLCLMTFFPVGAAERDKTFAQSGIHFPGGFDLNTVGSVNGKVIELHRPSGSGPVILQIETVWETYAVTTCPPWYWDELKIKIPTGEEVRVSGSKSLGKDGRLYIVAQEIYLVGQGKTIILRNKAGTPLWNGPHGKTGLQPGSGKRIRGQK